MLPERNAKNDFLQMVDFEAHVKDTKAELASEDLQIYVYGAGSYAKSVARFIKDVNKTITAFIVDDAFYQTESTADERQVVSASSFLEKIDTDCCLVMGMKNFLAGQKLQETCPFIKKIYYPTGLSFEKGREFSKDYLENNVQKFMEIYHLLADEKSRQCFTAWVDSAIHNDTARMFGLSDGAKTYFDNSLFKIKQGTGLIDVGAYNGDTILEFLEAVDHVFSKIWAVEGDAALCGKIQKLAEERGFSEKIEILHKCVWDKEGYVTADYLEEEINSVGMTIHQSQGRERMMVVPLDSIIDSECAIKADMIKVNMRGADKILKGAEHIIQKKHPVLAAKVGFDRSLFYDLINVIFEIDSTYKFYFRFNDSKLEELVLYAI